MAPEPIDLQSLSEMFLSDRESLSEHQYAAFVEALKASPEELSQLKDQLILDEKLGQMMAVDRADFPAQVAQRLRDLDRSEDDLLQQVQDMRELATQAYQPKRRRRGWSGWILAACVLLAAGVFYALPGLNDRPRVTRVFGDATLIRNDINTPLVAGSQLGYGDRILTQTEAFAILEYRDGTRLNIAGQSLVQFANRFRSGKVVDVNRGAVSSSVASQPKSRPMRFVTPRADAKIVGTELMLEVSSSQTRLNVSEGKVELRGLSGDKPVLVQSHQFAVSDGGDAQVSQLIWPSSRERLEVLLKPDVQQLPTDWDLLGDTQWSKQLRLRNGAAVLPVVDAQAVTDACKNSNELTIELVFRSNSDRQTGPARIVSLSSNAFTRNFTLGQENSYLIFRLRTPETGENGTNPELRLCRITDRNPHHVIVTWKAGELNCYLDGERVIQTSQIQGDFSNWTKHQQYLMLGDEWDSEQSLSWRGEIHALGIYSRALDSSEALRNMQAMPRQ